MNTELFIRTDLQYGDLTKFTYGKVVFGGDQYLEFTLTADYNFYGTSTINVFRADGLPLDINGNEYVTLTIDEIVGDHTNYQMLLLDLVDFNDFNTGTFGDLIVTFSPTPYILSNIDLYDDINMPITYSITDINDISKKSAARSLSINIPGTKNNNLIFRQLYSLDNHYNEPDFRLNRKVKAFIYYNTYILLEGIFILQNVKVTSDIVTYEGVIYSDTIGLFESMGSKLLFGNTDPNDDLDFSEYDHTLNSSYIENSFLNSGGSGVIYSPIDKYGHWNKSYNPGAVNSAGTFKYHEMTPCLFIKEIWDKIFEKHNFNYVSPFISDTYNTSDHYVDGVLQDGTFEFKKLVYPNIKQYIDMSQTNIDLRSCLLDGGFLFNYYIDPSIPSPVLYLSPTPNAMQVVTDLGNNWGGNKFTCPEKGYYSVKFSSRDMNVYIISNDYTAAAGIYTGNPSNNASVKVTCLFDIRKNGVQIAVSGGSNNFNSGDGATNLIYLMGPPDIYGNFRTIKPVLIPLPSIEVNDLLLETGDIIELYSAYSIDFKDGSSIYLVRNGFLSPVSANISFETFNSDFILEITRTNKTIETNTVDVTRILGNKMKQSDFINSVIKMFNLYIEPISSDTLYVMPRDYYYNNSNSLSFTYKLDNSKEKLIERVNDLEEKRINLKYKKDKDYFNTLYLENFSLNNLTYGELLLMEKVIIQPDNKHTVEVSFAPTVCGTLNNSELYNIDNVNACECPKIFSINSSNTLEYKEYEQRILYWQGLILRPSLITPELPVGTRGSIIIENIAATSNINLGDYYPCISTFDKSYGQDNFSLDFGKNNKYWVNLNGTQPTYQNLYWMYYQQMVSDYTNINSKLVTLYLYLSDSDLANINFSSAYFIDNIKYRINKIENYIPNTVCRVQLIKIPN